MKKNLLWVMLIGTFLVITIIACIFYYLEISHKSILVYGSESAGVKIIDYTSFECSACSSYYETFGSILEKYIEAGDIQLIIKPVDLNMFEYDGLIYSHLTENQINNYHELLKIYETQEVWSEFDSKEKVIEYLGLSNEVNSVLIEDLMRNIEEGQHLKLEGVPTTFLNGEKLPCNLTVEEFEAKIIRLIKS